MKFYIKILIGFFILCSVLFLLLSNAINNGLEQRRQDVNTVWRKLTALQKDTMILLRDIEQIQDLDINYPDVVSALLVNDKLFVNEINCNKNIVSQQYLVNKGILQTLATSESRKDNNDYLRRKLQRLNSNISKMNKSIEVYNQYVREYNQFYSVFPNFLFAKAKGFKRAFYFELTYGQENLDPKVQQKNTREWQRKIELEHGISE